MKKYTEIARMSEAEQIRIIGEHVTDPSQAGKIIGVVVNSQAKAERYIEKLTSLYPDIAIIDRFGLVDGLVTIRLRSTKTH